jgi:hypothetical protein
MFTKAIHGIKSKLDDEQIDIAVRNAGGIGGSLFASEKAFETLILTDILQLLEPSLQLVEIIRDEMVLFSNEANIASLG